MAELRIAVVTAHFPSSLAPTDGRTGYEVVRVLSRQNTVRVFFHLSAYPPLLSPRSRTNAHVDCSFVVPDVDVRYRAYPALPLVSRPFNGILASRVLLSEVRAFAPDLLYSLFLYPSGYCALRIGKALGIPVVVEGMGSDIHSIGDPISAFYTRRVLRESDFLFTVSESLRKRALAMGARPDKSRAVLNGCDFSVFQPKDIHEARRKLGIDPTAEVVVYVGRMDVKKGLRELVKAASLIHSQRATLQVYMVGNGPDKHIIEKAISSMGAENYIHLISGCSFDAVADWMACANLVTLPSYQEGCPNTVVEALACGRPVVATEVGGIPEIVGPQCGCLVPARDSKALAVALASVLDKSWDFASIAATHGRNWETGAEERLHIFKSLLY